MTAQDLLLKLAEQPTWKGQDLYAENACLRQRLAVVEARVTALENELAAARNQTHAAREIAVTLEELRQAIGKCLKRIG